MIIITPYLSLQNGANYLINCIKEDGAFIYEIDPISGKTGKGYNILRHAGAMFVLYQVLPILNIPHAPALLEKSTSYLKLFIKPLNDSGELFCVVENDAVKLGGSALALLALTARYKLIRNESELALMQNLGNFLVGMQQPSGKFKSKFYFSSRRDSGFESTYYPGEAILALLRLYAIDANPKWLDTAKGGIDYLIRNPVRNANGAHGHNHWLATALVDFFLLTHESAAYDELCRISDGTLASMDKNRKKGKNGYTFSSAAMATRGETLTLARMVETRYGKDGSGVRLAAAIEEVIDYCLNFQINRPTTFRQIDLTGGLMHGRTNRTLRIDYAQHFMQVLINLTLSAQPELV